MLLIGAQVDASAERPQRDTLTLARKQPFGVRQRPPYAGKKLTKIGQCRRITFRIPKE